MKPLAKPLQTVRGFPTVILILVSFLTFGLLQLLFSLQSTTGSGATPLLTLPAN